MATSPDSVLDELLDPISQCFTRAGAEKLVTMRASPLAQARIDELADRCNEGDLSDDERSEYDAYVRAITFISILQSKARALLKSDALP